MPSGEKSQGNLANMTSKGKRWQPGQSGNPSGKPRRMNTLITNALRVKLSEWDEETKQTLAERVAGIMLKCITHPDPELDKTRIQAISEVIDRVEGKATQQINVADVTAELQERSDEDLLYKLEHGYWPEDHATEMRKRKLKELAAKTIDAPTTEIQ
jgi:hypothetical protein